MRDSGLAWTILRPTMIYGTPEDRNIVRLIRFVDRSPVVPVVARRCPAAAGPRRGRRRCHRAAIEAPGKRRARVRSERGRAADASGTRRQTAAALGKRRLIVSVPLGPVRLALRVYNRITQPPRLTVEQIDRIEEDKAFPWATPTMRSAIRPRPFSEGVRQEVEALPASMTRQRAPLISLRADDVHGSGRSAPVLDRQRLMKCAATPSRAT